MDILPVYIVLLLCFPPVLWLLLRRPTVALMLSVAIYRAGPSIRLVPARLPERPLDHQPVPLAASVRRRRLVRPVLRPARRRWRSPITLGIAAAYLLFAFVIVLTWHFPQLEHFVPRWLFDLIYPIDKTNLDVLRLAHFLALAVLTVWLVPRDWSAFRSRLAAPRHAVRTAFAADLLSRHIPVLCRSLRLTEISGGPRMQVLVSLLGSGS